LNGGVTSGYNGNDLEFVCSTTDPNDYGTYQLQYSVVFENEINYLF